MFFGIITEGIGLVRGRNEIQVGYRVNQGPKILQEKGLVVFVSRKGSLLTTFSSRNAQLYAVLAVFFGIIREGIGLVRGRN